MTGHQPLTDANRQRFVLIMLEGPDSIVERQPQRCREGFPWQLQQARGDGRCGKQAEDVGVEAPIKEAVSLGGEIDPLAEVLADGQGREHLQPGGSGELRHGQGDRDVRGTGMPAGRDDIAEVQGPGANGVDEGRLSGGQPQPAAQDAGLGAPAVALRQRQRRGDAFGVEARGQASQMVEEAQTLEGQHRVGDGRAGQAGSVFHQPVEWIGRQLHWMTPLSGQGACRSAGKQAPSMMACAIPREQNSIRARTPYTRASSSVVITELAGPNAATSP